MNEIASELFLRWSVNMAIATEDIRLTGLASEQEKRSDLASSPEVEQSFSVVNEKARAAGQK